MNAKNPLTWNNRGAAEQSLGNYTAALNDYQRSSQLGLARGTDNYKQLKQIIASNASAAAQGNGGSAPRCAPNLSYTPDGRHGMGVYCNTYAASPPAGAVLGGPLH
jgi:hypothetical protein